MGRRLVDHEPWMLRGRVGPSLTVRVSPRNKKNKLMSYSNCLKITPVFISFQTFFNNPAVPLCMVVGLQLCLVALQVVILVRVSEWYQVVSLALLLFANYYTLFKLSRDYLVCWKVYKAEAMIQDKITGG